MEKIRIATKKDIPEIICLKIATWKDTYQGKIDSEYLNRMNAEELEQRLEQHFEENHRIVYEEDGKIKGFCVYGNRQEPEEGQEEYEGEICAVYVSTDSQRRGIGKALFLTAKNHMKEMGKKNFLIWCLKENIEARKFYERMGGKIVGEKFLTLGNEIYKEVAYGYEIKERYGFFGGSFNPPTIAHEKLAIEAIEEFGLDKVFFVPMGNKYPKPGLIEEKHRYQMLQLICENQPRLEVSDIELGKKLTAAEAFALIKEEYQNADIYFMMGADNFEKLDTWDRAEELVEQYEYIILSREGKLLKEKIQRTPLFKEYASQFHFLQNQTQMEYSSTKIREGIRENKDIKKQIRKKVIEYILQENLYQ